MSDALSDDACAYALTATEATTLAAAAVLPFDARMDFLRREWGRDPELLVAILASAIGAANALSRNAREAIELLGVIEGDMHPYTAEKLNLPSFLGAMLGARLAAGVRQDGLCAGCAFRHATIANMSPVTTQDAADCAREGACFLCHVEGLDESGRYTRPCVGWARARATEKAA